MIRPGLSWPERVRDGRALSWRPDYQGVTIRQGDDARHRFAPSLPEWAPPKGLWRKRLSSWRVIRLYCDILIRDMQMSMLPTMAPHTRVRLRLITMPLAFLLAAQCPPSSAQQIGITYEGTRAACDDVLQRPGGLSGYVDLPLGEWGAIRSAASHDTESRIIPCRLVLGWYICLYRVSTPGSDCACEPFGSDARLITYGVAVQSTSLAVPFELSLYALRSGPDVDPDVLCNTPPHYQRPPSLPDGLTEEQDGRA